MNNKIKKLLAYVRNGGILYMFRKAGSRFLVKYITGRWSHPACISKKERGKQENTIFKNPVRISIIVPLYNTPENFLKEMICSVLGQTYPNWELCLVDAGEGNGVADLVAAFSKEDNRIRYRKLSKNGGIAANSNEALAMAQGSYIALMDHDDILHPSALFYVVQQIERCGADFIYTDELSFVKKTKRVQSIHRKPEYIHENFCSTNYICHFTVFRHALLEKAGIFRSEFDGSQDYDLFFRLLEQAKVIAHIPKVLYFWRIHKASVASGSSAKPYTVAAGQRAITEHLKRVNLKGVVEPIEGLGTFYRVRYEIPKTKSVCILTEDAKTAEWVRKDLEQFSYPCAIIPFSGNEKQSLKHIQTKDYAVCIRSGYQPEERNGKWLIELLQCLQPPSNILASPVVYDRKGKVCHAGYAYQAAGKKRICPLYKGIPRSDNGYMNQLRTRHAVSFTGGAALAVKGNIFSVFLEKEGNMAEIFTQTFWFDLCRYVRVEGGDCILTPFAPFLME